MECGVGARRTTLQDFVQMCSLLPDSSPEIWILYTSVEHDPVSGSPSKWILQFRTGSGSDWISKNLSGSDMDIQIQTAVITAVKCLITVFTDINRIGSNI